MFTERASVMDIHRIVSLRGARRATLATTAILSALAACENPQEPDLPDGPTALRGVHRHWVIRAR